MCVIIMIIAFGFAIQHWMLENYFMSLLGFSVGLFFLLMLLNNIRTLQARKNGNCDETCRLTHWLKKLFTKRNA